jgi:heme/copper-type cytochrome/quinol oxidase subunit 4
VLFAVLSTDLREHPEASKTTIKLKMVIFIITIIDTDLPFFVYPNRTMWPNVQSSGTAAERDGEWNNDK